jgi:uncharacterized pyridoxal phosphate-dependent enzyme
VPSTMDEAEHNDREVIGPSATFPWMESAATVYERLGVTPLINGCDSVTRLGGSLMHPDVLASMAEAGRHFVYVPQLLQKAGQRIAQLVGVEAAFVTTGAAGGLLLAAAACIAGTDPARIGQLPDTSGMRSQILIEQSHRNPHDHAIRASGAALITYGSSRGAAEWELERAKTPMTAAVAYFVENATDRTRPLSIVADAAHRHGLPVIVDAAAELPPASNFRRFLDEGADLVVFSGGKALRGPQSTGLILGRADLIAACAANSSPNISIGRPLKVGKEEIVGLVVAVELFLAETDAQRHARWEAYLRVGREILRGIPGLQVELIPSDGMPLRPVPLLRLHIHNACPKTSQSILRGLYASPERGLPHIEVRAAPEGLVIDPQHLQPGEMELICRRIRSIVEN